MQSNEIILFLYIVKLSNNNNIDKTNNICILPKFGIRKNPLKKVPNIPPIVDIA